MHIRAPTQRHSQDERGEMMGVGSDSTTGTVNCRPQLQTSQCRRVQQFRMDRREAVEVRWLLGKENIIEKTIGNSVWKGRI
ncbi:hypothetical protein BDA96_04G319400 [Sorghum bicolor]|uniref:Uncharacterized protein n=1 Tax=Sorghum bicolor TaxID=4558 RepID=A0A921UMH8_SORBI|nr:hypothetical protein BDA96_04G319400 [Sorghum bicolor]